jgi:hypothetical protein
VAPRCPGDVRGVVGEVHRAADGQVLAPQFLIHLDNGAAGAQGGMVGHLFYEKNGRAGHVVRAQDVNSFVLGPVGQPFLDVGEDFEDVGLRALAVV